MFCKYCGNKLDNTNLCPNCGARILPKTQAAPKTDNLSNKEKSDDSTLQENRSTTSPVIAEEAWTKPAANRLDLERGAEEKRVAKEKSAKKRKKTIAISVTSLVVCIILVVLLTTTDIIPRLKMNRAMRLLDSGRYEAAYDLLEQIGNQDIIASSKLGRAVAAINSGDYELAYTLFAEIGYNESIAESKYDRAIAAIASGEYSLAKALLTGLDYKDSADILDSITPPAAVGSYIFFGSYEQDNNVANGKEPIEWLVLDKHGTKALLISKYILEYKPFNTEPPSNMITWEGCSLRVWLNKTFFDIAFSSKEQIRILRSIVTADNNPKYPNVSPGAGTTDRVFLLSIPEADLYFNSNASRECHATAYCYAQGARQESNGMCWWWLRSPGSNPRFASFVRHDGFISYQGDVANTYGAVRPAMWLDIGS